MTEEERREAVRKSVESHELSSFLNNLDLQCVMSLRDAGNLRHGVGLLFSALNAAARENNLLKKHIVELTGKLSENHLAFHQRQMELQDNINELNLLIIDLNERLQ